MRELDIHRYTGRAYSAEEIISFSQNPRTHFPDVDKEMVFHKNVSHVQVSNLTQAEFDKFVLDYGRLYQSIYFFQNTQVKDLSVLTTLKKVEFLLFYNLRNAKSLWNMSGNDNLKGIFISESKRLCYDLSLLPTAPSLEEFVLFSNMDRRYTVKSLEPLKNCKNLKRIMLECNTEDHLFIPEKFSHFETFTYCVDGYRNDQCGLDKSMKGTLL